MPRFTTFSDEELRPRVLTIKIGAGLHAAIREQQREIMKKYQSPSLNAALAAALHELVLLTQPELKQRTRDLMCLTDQMPRKGQR